MSNIEWILIIITIFLVILLFRYIQLKKQIRNLADQVNELNSGNSQQMLDISLIDKDLERLAEIPFSPIFISSENRNISDAASTSNRFWIRNTSHPRYVSI